MNRLRFSITSGPSTVQRAFCVGFAIFGGLYWFTEFPASVSSAAQGWRSGFVAAWPQESDGTRPRLITRELLGFALRNLTPSYAIGYRFSAAWNSNGHYYPATIVQTDGEQYQIEWVDGKSLQWTPAGKIASDSQDGSTNRVPQRANTMLKCT